MPPGSQPPGGRFSRQSALLYCRYRRKPQVSDEREERETMFDTGAYLTRIGYADPTARPSRSFGRSIAPIC